MFVVSGIFREARMTNAERQWVHEHCQVEFSAQEAQLEPRAENSTNSVLCACALGLVNFFWADRLLFVNIEALRRHLFNHIFCPQRCCVRRTVLGTTRQVHSTCARTEHGRLVAQRHRTPVSDSPACGSIVVVLCGSRDTLTRLRTRREP